MSTHAIRRAGSPPIRWRQIAPWAIFMGYLVATYAVAHGSLYTQGLCLTAAVFAVLALGVDLVATTGLYTLAQAGLFAIGAYTCAILAPRLAVSPLVLLPICVAVCVAVGVIVGAISMRVSGLYFTISTFLFTLIVNAVVSIVGITGGYNGIPGPLLANFPSWLSWLGASVAWVIMLVLLAAVGVSWSVRRSALHPVLLAIRDAEPLADAMGARSAALKVGAFGLSAGLAGAAGWAFSLLGFISPGQFSWSVSVNVLAMVVLGGMGTTVGPILGAAFISIFPAWVNINGIQQEMLFGAIFVLVIVLFPGGAVGVVATVADRLRPKRGKSTLVASPERVRPVAADLPLTRRVAQQTPEGPAVACRHVVFRYPNSRIAAVNGVDFTAEWGTVHGLIGPNGSGKTTLVDLISGRLRPESGTIAVAGERVDAAPASQRAGRGLMRTFQAARLVGELSAQSNVLMGLYSRVPRIAVRAPVWPFLPSARRDLRRMQAESAIALAFVGAAPWADHAISDMPHGAVQLAQLANVAVAQPTVIILDEPLAGLSPGQVDHVAGLLRELKDAGVCVILIEHQPAFVFALCDRVTVLGAGEVVASGAAAEVRADKQVREVYLGQ